MSVGSSINSLETSDITDNVAEPLPKISNSKNSPSIKFENKGWNML